MFKAICGIFVVLSVSAFAAHLPPSVQVCKRSDAGFNDCAVKNMKEAIVQFGDGNKELGLNKMEPLFIKQMTAFTNGTYQMEEIYDDMYVGGLTTSSVERFSFDFDKCLIEYDTISPAITIRSNYKLKGKMSLFDVNSHGKADQLLEHLKIDHRLKCDKFTKDGKEYIKVTDYTTNFHDFNMIMNFGNLMPGNKQISDELNVIMRENSNIIFTESKFNFERNFASIFLQLANLVFEKIPLEELFPK